MALSNAAKNKLDREKVKAVEKVERPSPFVTTSNPVSSTSGDANQPTIQGQTVSATGQPGQPSAPNGPTLMNFINPKPEYDTQAQSELQQQAKWNAIGRLLGAFGQLGGMAAGGDATFVPDNVSPMITGKLAELDTNYRDQLAGWADRGFQAQMYDNKLRNEDYQAKRDNEFTRQRDELQHENRKALAEQKAKDALRQLQAKSAQEQAEEMRSVGVNPDDPQAMDQYLEAMKRKFNSDVAYKNRMGRGGSGSAKDAPDEEFISVVRAGREKQLSELRNQLKELTSKDVLTPGEESMLKSLQGQIDDLTNIKISKSNQVAQDLYEREMQSRNAPEQPQRNHYVPHTLTSEGYKPVVSQEDIAPVIQNMYSTGDLSQVPQLVDMLMKSGMASSQEEAEQWIYEALNQ